MPRSCTVCQHRRRKAIDRELLAKGEAWRSYRDIAARHGLSKDAVFRHYWTHLHQDETRHDNEANRDT